MTDTDESGIAALLDRTEMIRQAREKNLLTRDDDFDLMLGLMVQLSEPVYRLFGSVGEALVEMPPERRAALIVLIDNLEQIDAALRASLAQSYPSGSIEEDRELLTPYADKLLERYCVCPQCIEYRLQGVTPLPHTPEG